MRPGLVIPFPGAAARSTVTRGGRPAADRDEWGPLLPPAVAAAGVPLLLAWTPGFSVSDTASAIVASAVAAFAAVSIVLLADRAGGLGDPLLFVAALASAGAAAIHFSVVRMHVDEYTLYGVFFVGSGIVQLAWSISLVLRRSRSVLVLGAIGNAAIVVLWLADRVGAMPIGPDAKESSPFGLGDGIASGFEAVLVVACIAALVRGWRRPLRPSGKVALTLATVGLTSLALLSVLGVAPSVLPPAM